MDDTHSEYNKGGTYKKNYMLKIDGTHYVEFVRYALLQVTYIKDQYSPLTPFATSH